MWLPIARPKKRSGLSNGCQKVVRSQVWEWEVELGKDSWLLEATAVSQYTGKQPVAKGWSPTATETVWKISLANS